MAEVMDIGVGTNSLQLHTKDRGSIRGRVRPVHLVEA